MNAGMIRLGGILLFVSLGMSLAGAIALVATDGQINHTLLIAGQAVLTALWVYVLWSTKALFNGQNHRSADIPIVGLVGLSLVSLIVSAVRGDSLTRFMTDDPDFTLTTMDYVSMGVSLVAVVLAIWFAIAAIRFGKRIGSGVWKAVGILSITAYGIIAIAVVALVAFVVAIFGAIVGGPSEIEALQGGSMNVLIYGGGAAAIIGGLVILASLICHGIGLITTAPQTPATGAARP